MKQSNHIAANVVHAYDGDFSALERRALALLAGRKPRKMGLYDQKIAKDKQSWRVGKDAFGLLYGSRNFRTVFLEAIDNRDMDNCPDRLTPAAQYFTERGDFSHLAYTGICL